MKHRSNVEARFGRTGRDDILEKQKALRALVKMCDQILFTYDTLAIRQELEIDGAKKFDYGIEEIRKYLNNARKAAIRYASSQDLPFLSDGDGRK